MNADNRTYRVPKRVVKQVDAAMSSAGHRHGNERSALDMAQVLTSGVPVPLSVPITVAEFFTRDWRFHSSKVRDAGLYGGVTGLEWARKCVGPAAVVADAAAAAEEGYRSMIGYSAEDAERLIAYGKVASSPRWSPEVEDQDELVADLLARIDEAYAPVTGVEDLTAEIAPPPAAGVDVLAVDEDDDDVEGGLTVAAMRDAVAAASAALDAATLAADAAVPAVETESRPAVAEVGEGNPKG